MSKAVFSEYLGFCIPHLFCVPPKCYKKKSSDNLGSEKNNNKTQKYKQTKITIKKTHKNPPARCEIGSNLPVVKSSEESPGWPDA